MKEKKENYRTGSFLFEFNDTITEETDLFKPAINSFGYVNNLKNAGISFGI